MINLLFYFIYILRWSSENAGPPIQCCVGAVICAVLKIENSTLFGMEVGEECFQDDQKSSFKCFNKCMI